jgi:hypothetical protein
MALFTLHTPEGVPVDFLEAAEGSQDAAVSTKQQVAKVIWKVAWADVENAKVALLGLTIARPADFAFAGAPAFFSRFLPHPHPKAPWLVCSEITKVEGRGPRGKDDDGAAKYEWGWLYTLYTKRNCAILADGDVEDPITSVPNEALLKRFVKKRRKPAAKFFTSRVGSWYWFDTLLAGRGIPVAMELPFRIPQVRVQWVWLDVPLANLNEPYINDTVGTTNNGNFAGYPGQSLLLNGADWPDLNPIPGRDGFQVDVLFDVLYYGVANGVQTSPNSFPDPNRGNRILPVAAVRSLGPPAVIEFPIEPRDWAPMFQPINT